MDADSNANRHNGIGSIVVVVGGTAGWMTATYPRTALDGRTSITLAESPRMPAIGAGEATFSAVGAGLAR